MNFHGGNIYKYKKDILDYSSNINPLGVPETFKRSLLNNMNELTKYPDIDYIELKQTIAKYLQINVYKDIILGNGAVEIIYKAIDAMAFEKVISVSPTFSEYRRGACKNNIPFVEVPLKEEEDYEVNLNSLLVQVSPHSLVVLCNPNNPTGKLISVEKLHQFILELADKQAYLLIDESFIEFTEHYPSTSMVSSYDKYDNVLIVRAATKFFGMPGIRLGYGVTCNMDWKQKIYDQLEPWNINTIAVLAGLDIFNNKEYIKKSRENTHMERNFIYNELSNIPQIKVYKTESNFFLVRFTKENMDVYQLRDKLLQDNILIRVPKGFSYLTDKDFRIAIKSRRDNLMLVKALKRALI